MPERQLGAIETSSIGIAIGAKITAGLGSLSIPGALSVKDVRNGTTGYRYVSEGEAAGIRANGFISNMDKAGKLKEIFYTNDAPIRSAHKALTRYSLSNNSAYRVSFNVSSINNIYGGIAEGGGTELITKNPIGNIISITRLSP